MELDELMTQHHSLLDEIETFQYGEEHKAILGPLLDRINEFVESMDEEKWEEMPEKKKKELNKLLGERTVLRKVTQAKDGFEKFRDTVNVDQCYNKSKFQDDRLLYGWS
jgi:predicted ATPase with chaperone activity